jgi:hypothetical protein
LANAARIDQHASDLQIDGGVWIELNHGRSSLARPNDGRKRDVGVTDKAKIAFNMQQIRGRRHRIDDVLPDRIARTPVRKRDPIAIDLAWSCGEVLFADVIDLEGRPFIGGLRNGVEAIGRNDPGGGEIMIAGELNRGDLVEAIQARNRLWTVPYGVAEIPDFIVRTSSVGKYGFEGDKIGVNIAQD